MGEPCSGAFMLGSECPAAVMLPLSGCAVHPLHGKVPFDLKFEVHAFLCCAAMRETSSGPCCYMHCAAASVFVARGGLYLL